jgi:flavin-dependent dehydrogenase
MEHAREKGAEILEETSVYKLIMEGERVVGVEVLDKSGQSSNIRASMVMDASGKEALTSRQRGWRLNDPYLNKIAIWTYYQGSKRGDGIDEGATTVAFVPEKGWFWHIPLHNNMVSVGVVAEGKYLSRDGVKDPKVMFTREIDNNLWIKEHLATGECTGKFWVTSEYSRHSQYCAAPGLLLVGDAFAFLDPVFSSGVMLALKSGVLGAEAVHEGLVAGDPDPKRFASYGQQIRMSIENMRKLVYAFYDAAFSFKDVVMKYPEAGDYITDCLSGDLERDYSQLWSWMSEFTQLPADLPYGVPLQQHDQK